MKLGILLAKDPITYRDASTALKIADAALDRGDEVQLFLLDSGVLLADSAGNEPVHSRMRSLLKRGGRAVLCEKNAGERGIEGRVMEGVEVDSVVESGRIAEHSDRFLALT